MSIYQADQYYASATSRRRVLPINGGALEFQLDQRITNYMHLTVSVSNIRSRRSLFMDVGCFLYIPASLLQPWAAERLRFTRVLGEGGHTGHYIRFIIQAILLESKVPTAMHYMEWDELTTIVIRHFIIQDDLCKVIDYMKGLVALGKDADNVYVNDNSGVFSPVTAQRLRAAIFLDRLLDLSWREKFQKERKAFCIRRLQREFDELQGRS